MCFLVHIKLKQSVINFKPIDERICSLKMRANFFYISRVCVYVRTEEAKVKVEDVGNERIGDEH